MSVRNRVFILSIAIAISAAVSAQTSPSFKESQQLYVDEVYRRDTIEHTAWKPVLLADSTTQPSTYSWLRRKFFQEHLLSVQKPGFNLYGDVIVDENIGYNSRSINPPNASMQTYNVPMMNTRGYEVSGNIGDKFYFETAFYESQGRFPAYVDSLVRITQVIPHQANYKNSKGDGPGFDFNYSTARLVYKPNKHLLFDLGYNHNFIGDGYRSLLLSDWSINYPYLRAGLTFGKLQYSVMWSQYLTYLNRGIASTPYYALGYSRKWAQTYLLDYAVTSKFNIGLFESVVWAGSDINKNSDINASYASPVIFAHSYQSKTGIDNNELIGLNLKYTYLPKANAYAQFALDKTGSNADSRYALQIGTRFWDFLGVDHWNALLEFNTARPYTYNSTNEHAVYGHANLPLAHPLGANFRELVGVTDYRYKNWWFRLEAFFAQQGLDRNDSLNFGSNPFNLSTTYPSGDNKTVQGLKTNIYYGDLRVAYVLNPKTNLRLEGGFVYRRESNVRNTWEDKYAYIGVRMSFRDLVYDF